MECNKDMLRFTRAQDPYFLLLDANGDGILAASEVFHFATWPPLVNAPRLLA